MPVLRMVLLAIALDASFGSFLAAAIFDGRVLPGG